MKMPTRCVLVFLTIFIFHFTSAYLYEDMKKKWDENKCIFPDKLLYQNSTLNPTPKLDQCGLLEKEKRNNSFGEELCQQFYSLSHYFCTNSTQELFERNCLNPIALNKASPFRQENVCSYVLSNLTFQYYTFVKFMRDTRECNNYCGDSKDNSLKDICELYVTLLHQFKNKKACMSSKESMSTQGNSEENTTTQKYTKESTAAQDNTKKTGPVETPTSPPTTNEPIKNEETKSSTSSTLKVITSTSQLPEASSQSETSTTGQESPRSNQTSLAPQSTTVVISTTGKAITQKEKDIEPAVSTSFYITTAKPKDSDEDSELPEVSGKDDEESAKTEEEEKEQNRDVQTTDSSKTSEKPGEADSGKGDTKVDNGKLLQEAGNSVKNFNAGEDETEGSGHFLAYFLTAVVICVSGYIIYHNKQKILAFIIEGRNSGKSGRQRSKDVKYTQLKSNVEEVMPSLEQTATSKNYVY